MLANRVRTSREEASVLVNLHITGIFCTSNNVGGQLGKMGGVERNEWITLLRGLVYVSAFCTYSNMFSFRYVLRSVEQLEPQTPSHPLLPPDGAPVRLPTRTAISDVRLMLMTELFVEA